MLMSNFHINILETRDGLGIFGFPLWKLLSTGYHPSYLHGRLLILGLSYDILNLADVADDFIANSILQNPAMYLEIFVFVVFKRLIMLVSTLVSMTHYRSRTNFVYLYLAS